MKTQNTKRHDIRTRITSIALIIAIVLALWFGFELAFNQGYELGYQNASSEFLNYSIAGYNQRAIEVNNMLIRDLSIYGYANYPVYYNNETFNLRCEVEK